MNSTYRKISQIAHQKIYEFIKLSQLDISNYHFQYYFDYITNKNNIIVFPHHFDNDLILGITMVDNCGISLSYEKNSIGTRQNFTKCHELGHIILKHQGKVFTEQVNNKSGSELEADYFSSIILAPDIVLIHKILYQNKRYSEISKELSISNLALEVRLTHLLQTYTTIPYPKIKGMISSFRANTNYKQRFIDCLVDFQQIIVSHYNTVTPKPLHLFDYLLEHQNLITQCNCPQLIEKEFQEQLLNQYNNIKIWSYYNKGKTLWYAWNTDKLTDIEAKQKAKLIYTRKFL